MYYTPEEIKRFETDPEYLEQYYHTLWDQLESMYPAWVNESEAQKGLNAMVKAEYEERIKDPVLREKLTPDFRVGCRRVTPSDTYLEAIQAPNAEIVFEKISHITKDGIVTVDGKEYKADVLVCATGFDCSFVPNWKMVGKGGVVLSEMWHDYPDNYKSIMAPNFPN